MTNTKQGPSNYLKKGSWNCICDRCGRKYKREQMKLEWTGLLTCTGCWDPRHPATLPLPIVLDGLAVPLARPRQEPSAYINLPGFQGVWGQYYITTGGETLTDPKWGGWKAVWGGVSVGSSYTDLYFPSNSTVAD